jgi:hypothetical protein
MAKDKDSETSSFSPGGMVDGFKRFAQGTGSPSRTLQVIGWLILGFFVTVMALILISGLLGRG